MRGSRSPAGGNAPRCEPCPPSRHARESTVAPGGRRTCSFDLEAHPMGITLLLERPKAWSGPPNTFGYDTAKPLEERPLCTPRRCRPISIPSPAAGCRSHTATTSMRPGQQTFDLLSDPHGGSLAGLRGPGGLRLHSPRVAAALRPVNTYLRRSISSSLSLVHTSGKAGLRGIVFEPMVWKTPRFRVAQASSYGSTATIYKC